MANETLFTTKATSYAKGRPSYAPGAIGRILDCLAMGGYQPAADGPWARIADIGSGTGILSRELIGRNLEVYGVEPNEAMREKAEHQLGTCGHFHSVAASAESTGLPDHSMAMVTAASAFHWFDPEAFRRECLRILVPGGLVCLLINVREYDDFTRRQHELCRKYGIGFTSLIHGFEETKEKAAVFFEEGFHLERFDFPLTYEKEAFISRSLSSSYAPEAVSENGRLYMEGLQRLLEEIPQERFTVANFTALFWGKPCAL